MCAGRTAVFSITLNISKSRKISKLHGQPKQLESRLLFEQETITRYCKALERIESEIEALHAPVFCRLWR
jgi:hypothetical protein